MSEPKTFASLSASLLARKGQAKPAMRPHAAGSAARDDLGWDDMGEDAMAATPRPVPIGSVAVAPSAPPPVVRQQAELAREIGAASTAPRSAEAAGAVVRLSPPAARQPRGASGKAAFTLRLDPERHLRLRLACAVKHLSAQQIVTEALDKFLTNLPEIDDLAAQLPSPGKAAGR